MKWKRLRQNAEEKLKSAFLDPDPKPETAEVQPLAERTEPARTQLKQEAPLLPYQRPGWFPPFLTAKRKAAVDRADRRLRGQISKYASATGD
jgi:hypothetical protein